MQAQNVSYYCVFKWHADSNNKYVFRYCSSNVQRPLPASGYSWVYGNQIVEHSSENKTVLGRNRKLGGAIKSFIDGGKNRICQLSFEFWSLHVIERSTKTIAD